MPHKDIPNQFDIDSEEDVRFVVAQYFSDLGFTATEMSFEDRFFIRLGHSEIEIKSGHREGETEAQRLGGRSDILLTRNGTPLAVIEVKRDGHALTDDDCWQGISYARLLRRIAPFAIITNGNETQVYDVLGDTNLLSELRVDNPTDSKWHKNGQRIAGINQDIRFFAAQKLISINPTTVESFCLAQSKAQMSDLVGTINNNRIYIPNLYIEREELETTFETWLSSEFRCFGLFGESGCGKTNFFCSKAIQLSSDYLVLFYRSVRLRSGLFDAIRSDAEWEFQQNKSVSYIVNRLADIANDQDKEVIIFVDALDEFTGNLADLKSELLDFVNYAHRMPVRLCVSCKTFDWEKFVIDNAQSFNEIARAIFPQSPTAFVERVEKPKFTDIGFQLARFSQTEGISAFAKYKIAYSLSNDELKGDIQTQCLVPLNLRLLAEAYRDRTGELPTDMSTEQVFSLFIDRKLSQVTSQNLARRFLGTLSEMLLMDNKRSVVLDQVLNALDMSQDLERTVDDLLRQGLLIKHSDNFDLQMISFPFEKLRSYVYIFFNRYWNGKPSNEIAIELQELIKSGQQLNLEVVQFYLSEIDRGGTDVLTYMLEQDIVSFFYCMPKQFIDSEIDASIQQLDDQERSKLYWRRLEQYAISYSKIRLKYFPELASRIVPFTLGQTGVAVSESGDLVQLRKLNEKYPNHVLIIPNNLAQAWFKNTLPTNIFVELGEPTGTMFLGGMHDLLKEFPQLIAWKQIQEEVSQLFDKGLLNEVHAPQLLEERIRETLLHKPNMWVGEKIDRFRCYERLGFTQQQDVYETPLKELAAKAHQASLEITSTLVSLDDGQIHQERFWTEQLRYMYLLDYWCNALAKFQDFLTLPILSLNEIFATVRNQELAVEVMMPFVNPVLESYKHLVESNFLAFIPYLKLYQHLESDLPVAVEITRNPYENGLWSDFFEVRFITLPATFRELDRIVFWATGKNSLAHLDYISEDISGNIGMHRGGRFGLTKLTTQIGSVALHNVNAFVYKVRFPDRQLVGVQAYSLIGTELGELFRSANGLGTFSNDTMHLDYQRLTSIIVASQNHVME